MKPSLIAAILVAGLAANGAVAEPTVFSHPGESPWWSAPEATSHQTDSRRPKAQVRTGVAEREGLFNFNP